MPNPNPNLNLDPDQVLVDPAGNGKGVLVLSDALNHSSIVEGVRGSGCKVQPLAHNDMEHLEA